MVCQAFILAYRILRTIVDTNGEPEWLRHDTLHCHVRRDLFDTELGVKWLGNVIEVETTESSSAEQEILISY
jgi:hypothetical protein